QPRIHAGGRHAVSAHPYRRGAQPGAGRHHAPTAGDCRFRRPCRTAAAHSCADAGHPRQGRSAGAGRMRPRYRAAGAGRRDEGSRRHGTRSAGCLHAAAHAVDRRALPRGVVGRSGRCRIAGCAGMTEAGLNERLRMLATDGDRRAPRIAIVAPSGYAPRPELVERGIAALRAQGCSVRDFTDPDRKFQRFGATDDERIAQLYAAANDADIDIVLALRGGYGLSRLLPSLDFAQLAASGKLFVGHSDFTVLQMGMLQQGGLSFSGPMLCDDFVRDEPSAFTLADFWQCLTQPAHTVSGEDAGNPDCDVYGTLWGGNLAMLTHLAGSPWLPQIDGGILFVEDVNEHPY